MSPNGNEAQVRAFLEDSHLLKMAAKSKQGRVRLQKFRQQFEDEQARLLARLQLCNDAVQRLNEALEDIAA
ncbi:hypothetical protein [Pseudoxanthomonas japonensis]|uniref:hypothetical protein n=1 Tax=Pseudoxanthomonas japonensis TaxID=69284 RepID=UPI001BD11540|nr:hypothetical protein [Pseudoxanthomonas japonensis]